MDEKADSCDSCYSRLRPENINLLGYIRFIYIYI